MRRFNAGCSGVVSVREVLVQQHGKHHATRRFLARGYSSSRTPWRRAPLSIPIWRERAFGARPRRLQPDSRCQSLQSPWLRQQTLQPLSPEQTATATALRLAQRGAAHAHAMKPPVLSPGSPSHPMGVRETQPRLSELVLPCVDWTPDAPTPQCKQHAGV